MTKTQRKALTSLIVFSVVALGIILIAYSMYSQRSEESYVYLGIFQPDPNKNEFKNVVVLSKPSICESGEAQYAGLPKSAVNDFVAANSNSAEPIRLSMLEGQVPIVSWEDTRQLYERGTTDFYKPKGYRLLKLSRVGFNKEKTEAVACIEISDGYFGEGILFYLRKSGQSWSIVETRNIWIS